MHELQTIFVMKTVKNFIVFALYFIMSKLEFCNGELHTPAASEGVKYWGGHLIASKKMCPFIYTLLERPMCPTNMLYTCFANYWGGRDAPAAPLPTPMPFTSHYEVQIKNTIPLVGWLQISLTFPLTTMQSYLQSSCTAFSQNPQGFLKCALMLSLRVSYFWDKF